jgi:hypothetical protein
VAADPCVEHRASGTTTAQASIAPGQPPTDLQFRQLVELRDRFDALAREIGHQLVVLRRMIATDDDR